MTDTAAGGLQAMRDRYGDALNREIEGWVGRLGYPRQFPGMLRYALGYVDERLRPANHPGKRVRPFLCMAIAEAYSGRYERALPVAAGIELLHNFSLIHDDIEDRDPERHHRPTVWKVWGEPQAINAGDAMFAVAMRAVAGLEDTDRTLMLVEQFGDMAMAVTKGQYLDMSFEERHEVTTDEYLEMISLKSAALIAFSAWAGAIAGGATDAQAGALQEFGHFLGLAFQIYDDINGIWADPSRTGKVAHTDLVNRKKTLPVLMAAAAAGGEDREMVQRFYRGESDYVDALVAVLERTGARSNAEIELQTYLREAESRLRSANMPGEWSGHIWSLAREFTGQPLPTS